MQKKKVLCIIPARGGSKRLKLKNIKLFYKKPIIWYAIENAKKSKIFNEIHISTESIIIKKVVEKKIKISFLRNKKLSKDKVETMDVVKWVIEKFKEKDLYFDYIFVLYPCSPLINKFDLINANKIFLKNNMKNPLHVISKYPVPIEWAYTKKGKLIDPKFPGYYKKSYKELKHSYYECGPFSIFSVKHLYQKKFNQDKNFIYYEIDNTKAVDIDDLNSFNLAKVLFNKK